MRAFILAVFGIINAPGPVQDQKAPIPDSSAQKDAEKLIRDVFKDDYAKKTPTDRLALAKKLLDQADQTKDDRVSRYVLLREARDLAGQSGDLDLAYRAVDQIAAAFEGEVATMKAAVLGSIAKVAKAPEDFEKLARACMALIDEASNLEQYDVAEKSAEQASSFARRAKNVPLTTKAEARARQIPDRKVRLEKIKKARETLVANPADPAANLAVGIYEGAIRGNWEIALPLLAKASDSAVKSLAEKELVPR